MSELENEIKFLRASIRDIEHASTYIFEVIRLLKQNYDFTDYGDRVNEQLEDLFNAVSYIATAKDLLKGTTGNLKAIRDEMIADRLLRNMQEAAIITPEEEKNAISQR